MPPIGVWPEAVPSSQPAYGVNFISWAKGLTPVSQTRYDHGKATGATWNRWPLYWNQY
jgi:hypothetical protein